MNPEFFVRCAPDEVAGVVDLAVEGSIVRGSMSTGDRITEPGGTVALGALAVLVDNVLGYAGMTAAPGRWSVTTEMTLDVFPALQRSGGSVHAEARVVHADDRNGYAIGTVLSASGEIVASCTQRSRFLDGRPVADATAGATAEPRPRPLRPADVFAGTMRPGHTSTYLRVGPAQQNPLGNLHGGVSTYACDRAAARLLASDGGDLDTTSVQVVFLRPAPAGSVVELRPTLVHRGRTLAVVDVAALLEDGRPVVVARATAQPLVR